MTDVERVFDATVESSTARSATTCARSSGSATTATSRALAGRGEPFIRLGVQQWTQSIDVGIIGRCLRERRPIVVNDVLTDPDYQPTRETQLTRSELVVPVWVGEELWGAINIEEEQPHAFDEDDTRLVQTVADQVGAALRSASLYARLERAYLGTAEALAAALEAKDAYTAEHARSIVQNAEAVAAVAGHVGGRAPRPALRRRLPRHRQDRRARADPRTSAAR